LSCGSFRGGQQSLDEGST